MLPPLRVLFGELIDYVKYPDWDWEQEPLDEHNYRIIRQRMRSDDADGIKPVIDLESNGKMVTDF